MRDLPDIAARCHLESASADSKLVLVHKRGYILRFRLHQERVIFLNLAKQNMTAYNAKHPYDPDWQIPLGVWVKDQEKEIDQSPEFLLALACAQRSSILRHIEFRSA